MDFSLGSRYVLSCFGFVFFLAALALESLAVETPISFSFSFQRFDENSSSHSEIALYGDANISDSFVRITRPTSPSTGRMVYVKPFRFEGRDPGFSTHFSFSISPGSGGVLAFLVVPSNSFHELIGGGLSGLIPSIIAVEFNASMEPGSYNLTGNNVAINLGKHVSVLSDVASSVNVTLNSGERLQTWVDYNGESKRLEVRLSKSNDSRPSDPLISYSIELSNVLWREQVFVGISSSTQNSKSCLYSWIFATKHGDPYLMHSRPLDPQLFPVRPIESHPIHLRRNFSWRILLVLVFGAACGAMVAFLVVFVWSAVVFRRPVAPVKYPVYPMEYGCDKVILDEGEGAASSKK